MSLTRRLARCVAFFLCNRQANIAITFAVGLIPLLIATGVGLDYARALMVRAEMSSALDEAALAVATQDNLNADDAQKLAERFFSANYHYDNLTLGGHATVTVRQGDHGVTFKTSAKVATSLLNLVGIKSIDVGANSTVVWGGAKYWIALVLDNTGSMCASDAQPNLVGPCPTMDSGSKMQNLRTGAHAFIAGVKHAGKPGDVMVAIVPFAKDVNVGPANAGATWVDFSKMDKQGGFCLQTGGTDPVACAKGRCQDGSDFNEYECPFFGSVWVRDTWITFAPDHSNWSGCVIDRGDEYGPVAGAGGVEYDVSNEIPSSGASLFVADPVPVACPAPIMGLTDDWDALDRTINAMMPTGATNQPIGLVWGWQLMTENFPFPTQGKPVVPAVPDGTQRYIVLFSDGLNTQDRWYYNGNSSSYIDARMAQVCTNAKAAGIIIYAVYVHTGRDPAQSNALASCATDAAHYFDLSSAAAIGAAFLKIGNSINAVHLSH